VEVKEGADRMLIAILNQTNQSPQPTVTNADVATMTAAIASQIQSDVAPIWGRAPATVTFYTDSNAVPTGAYRIAIVDTIPNQPTGVVGGHTEDQAGQMWGVVAAQPDLTNGGQVLTGDWSLSSTLSHEVLEMFIDPNCNMWANDAQGSVYSLEVCDPVEAPTYTVNGVSVSNFVTPAWFDPQAPSGSQFDKVGLLTAGFSILPGGYMTSKSVAGKPQQQWGEAYPGWRKTMKGGPEARGQQRLLQLQAMWHQ
jgi:hypothetical protein